MLGRIAALLLRVAGWRIVFVPPPGPRSVLIFYPHTTNWDFVIGMLARAVVDFRFNWIGKHTIFRWPVAGLWRRLGGAPVNRSARVGLVAEIAEQFRRHDEFHLALSPEGTRSRAGHLKSGFYRVATAVGVPVGLGFIDYRRRLIGVERWLTLSGDEAADLAALSAYYADKAGLRPEYASPIRFHD